MILIIILLSILVSWKIYEYSYFHGQDFIEIRNRKEKYIKDCNDLNKHIEELKRTYIGINQLDYGKSNYYDTSLYNYKRPELKKQKFAPNVYNCSRTVCDNSRKQPFKYICKYFNIKATEETLEQFEKVLNNFESAEIGKRLLKREKESIIESIKCDIPFLIRTLSKKKIETELGFENIDFTTTYFPRFIFKYISSGGNASTQNDIVLGIDNLNRFINYLSEIVKFKKSVAGQRALMTSVLRTKILQRDNFTCQECGISKFKEPNILLEIDHIIPLSKGGITSENNLQVLCWKCNRSKGNKIKNGGYIVSQSNDLLLTKEKNNETKVKYIKETISDKSETKDEGIKIMYDKENGIYPEGQYIVGEDIEIGKYLLTSKKNFEGAVSIYENYSKYKKDEMLSFNAFTGEYYLALREDGMFIEVSRADIKKI